MDTATICSLNSLKNSVEDVQNWLRLETVKCVESDDPCSILRTPNHADDPLDVFVSRQQLHQHRVVAKLQIHVDVHPTSVIRIAGEQAQ